jgi:hypothetical protein
VLSEDAPLMQRGWVLQERFLSPRVLHYGQQMYWECRRCMWTEGEDFNPTLNNLGRSSKRLRPRASICQAKGEWPLSKYWSRILKEDYTARSLTNEMDKLPALAGLAQDAQRLTGDEYCAGLWRSSLPLDLLWKRKSREFMQIPSGFRAPTWSWAALDGQIENWKKGGWISDEELTYEHHMEIGISDVYVK